MIGMIETIQAIRLTCDACGNVRIIDAAEALPRRCAKKACQSMAWNKAAGIVKKTVEELPREAKPQKIEETHHINDAKPQPIARAPKVKNPPWKEVKPPAGKKKLCPHGFAVVSGITACARCN